MGAFAVLDRPFNVVTDRGQLGSGVDFVRDSLGPWAAGGSVLACGRPGGWRCSSACPGRSGDSRRWSARHRAGQRPRGRGPRRRLGGLRGVGAPGSHPAVRSPRRTPGRSWSARCAPRRPPTGTRSTSTRPSRRTPSATRPRPTCPPWRARTSSSPSSRATAGSRWRGPSPQPVRTLLDREGARLAAAWATRHPAAGSPPRRSGAAAGWRTPRCQVVQATRIPIVSAGSIATFERITEVWDSGAWGFTIGSAFFEKSVCA